MALTRQTGVLGQPAQRNLAATRNAQLVRSQPVAAPVYQAPVLVPRSPVAWNVPRSAPSSSLGAVQPRASAAQQIIQQAVANRLSPGRNVLQPAAQRALATALAVAGNPAAASFQPRDVRAMQPNNRFATVMKSAFTPQQESQLFDQQMQITKAEAAQYTPMGFFEDPLQTPRRAQLAQMQSGFANAAPNVRLQQESQALAAFPQMTPQELRTRSDSQLAALLDLATKPPAAPTAAGTSDTVVDAGQYNYPGMSKTPTAYAPVNAEQYRVPPGPMGWENGYPTRTSGAAQVADAMGAVLTRTPQGVTQGGTLADDDDGGFVGSLIGLGGDLIGELGELLGGVKDAATGTFEDFLRHPKVRPILEALEWMDAGRVMNTENYGEMFTQWANNEPVAWTVGGPLNPINAAAATPVILIGEALEEVDPTIRDQINAVSQNGYSSPQYIARLQEAGIDPATAPPQFTGDQAVWEYLMGKSDGWPAAAKYPFRIITDLFIDPLNYLPMAGAGGKALKDFGKAMKGLDDVSDAGRLIGTGAEVVGTAVEIGAKAPDLVVEVPIKAGRKLGGAVGEFTGLFSPATKGLRIEGRELAAQADDALVAARDSVPVRGTRVAFDAEAQGVTPTSGPELIDTPTVSSAVDTPTIVAREGGDVTVTPRTGTAVADRPTGGTIINGYEVRSNRVDDAGLIQVERSVSRGGGQPPVRISGLFDGSQMHPDQFPSGFNWDGVTGRPFASEQEATAALDEAVTRHLNAQPPGSFTESAISQPSAATPTSGGGPTLADVNRQIAELRSNPPEGMTSREAAAEMLRLKTLRNDMRAGRVPSDGSAPPSERTGAGTPPSTPVEREAAAAANSVPGEPRNTGEAEAVRAASGSTGKKRIPTVKGHPNLNKATTRAKRLAKEDAKGLKKAVNDILRPQKKGEHEFSPIYDGHRPLDKIVTDAIDSKDPAKLKQAEAFVKQVDESVETNLRTDHFYQTWANGGAPVQLWTDPRYSDEFFEAFRVFEPDATPERLKVLASGLAKGVLDDIGLLQFQLNHLLPMIAKQYPEYLDDLSGLLGSIGRIESKNFRGESAQWLIREYLDTTNPDLADTILLKFLTGNTELPVLADGIHKPYAHSIPAAYHAESIKRLRGLRDQWAKTKREVDLRSPVPVAEPPAPPRTGAGRRSPSSLGFAQSDPISDLLLTDAGKLRPFEAAKRVSRNILASRPSVDPSLLPVVTKDGFGGELDGTIIRFGDEFPAISSEQSPVRALGFIDPNVPARIDELYLASVEESWLGLGGNKGVSLQFDPKMIRGQITEEAPPFGDFGRFAYLIGREANPQVYRDALRSVTIQSDRRLTSGPADAVAQKLEQLGWRAEKTPDGYTRYVRPMATKPRGVSGFAATADPLTEAITSRRRPAQRQTMLNEVSDAAFREADQAAQFGGSARGAGRSLGQQIAAARSATKHRVPTPAEIEAAIGSIKDVELRNLLLKGNAKFTVEFAQFGDRMLPADWSPPGYKGFPIVGSPKTEWNVKEGLDFIREYKAMHPDFDYLAARNEIGELAMGLQPKRTKAEVASMKKAARAAGLDDSAIKDGTSTMERITATKLVRGFDGFMTALRSTRMYSPITGTPGRIGDIFGNAMAHAVAGKDPWSAVRQFPLTFTSTKAYRKVARDPNQLIKHYAETTSHMADTGMTYNPKTFRGSIKLSDETDAQLPWLNDKLKNTPRGVRAMAAVWSTPYLKDTMVAGELIGRKMAVDRVFLDTIRREGYPAFVEYLEKRFPGQSKQLLKEITESGREKGGRSWSGGFSYGDVRAAVDEDAARVWQGELNRAMAKGDAEAERLFFNNRNTNADEIARRTFTFHYWMTRATALYGRTLLQNPGMLSGFVRMYQEAQQISEEQGLPDWLSTMFEFYQSDGGMYAAFNPIGVLFPTVVMDAYSQEGNKFQAFQNLLSPVWGGALGAIGLTQNVPDTLGTRTVERFFIDMFNFLKGQGVDLESIPGFGKFFDNDSLTLTVPTEELTKLIITKANQLLGEPFGEFTPFDRSANEYDQVYSIGQQIGIDLWGPDIQNWTPEQVAELTAAVEQAINGDGEETWLSETIRATYGQEGGLRALASIVTPGGTVTRQGFRDQQIELSQEYWQDFYAGKPTTKLGEAAAASRQLATSAQPVWVAMNNEYYNIGTKEQQQKYGLYTSILNGPEDLNPKAVIVTDNGDGTYTFFTMAELAEMDWEDRVKIVEAWAANTEGMVDAYQTVKQGRDAFKAQHPDYAQYSEYQKGVYAYEDKGGIKVFRQEMADNPTFKAAEDAKRKWLKEQGKSGAVLEAELDHWATTQEAYFAAMGEPWKKADKPKGTAGPRSAVTIDRIMHPQEDKGTSGGSGGKKDETPKDPNVDDYWSPEKGVPRLVQDQQQYDYDNDKMERDFGPYWNHAKGEWEDDYDSAKERDEAGIGGQTYVLPSVSETMRRYEDWAEDHPGGTPEQFFDEMLKTEGFGIKPKAPGTKATQLPAGGTTYRPTSGRDDAIRQHYAGGRSVSSSSASALGFAAPSKSGGKLVMTGGSAYPLSQGYGMTDFAATQVGPGGMYDYTDDYTRDGSHVGHMGLDIATPLGTPLFAPVSGTVVQAGGVPWEQDDRYGDQPGTGGLRIEMPNGDIVVMGHMQQITVNVGDSVSAGQPVGYSGTAGSDLSDPGAGAHVHVEYRQYAPGATASGYLAVDPRTKLDL